MRTRERIQSRLWLCLLVVLCLQLLVPTAAAQTYDEPTAPQPDNQDWPEYCFGPDDPFCGGDDIAQKDCSKIVVNSYAKCREKCQCQYDKDFASCKKLSGGAYTARWETAQRAKEQCLTQCEIDFS